MVQTLCIQLREGDLSLVNEWIEMKELTRPDGRPFSANHFCFNVLRDFIDEVVTPDLVKEGKIDSPEEVKLLDGLLE